MAYGYPIELRARALSSLDQGMSRKQVSEIFQIASRTLYNWCKRRQETGNVGCKKLPSVRSTRKITKEKLLAHLSEHPDHYLKEIAAAFDVKAQSVFVALKKFGISRKKNDPLLRARREKEARVSIRNREDRS